MLTEKSITQQLRFHKLPFPEDSGVGGILEEITALFKKVDPPAMLRIWFWLPFTQREGI